MPTNFRGGASYDLREDRGGEQHSPHDLREDSREQNPPSRARISPEEMADPAFMQSVSEFVYTLDAFVVMVSIMTFDTWRDLLQPIFQHRPVLVIFFFVYISIAGLLLMNMVGMRDLLQPIFHHRPSHLHDVVGGPVVHQRHHGDVTTTSINMLLVDHVENAGLVGMCMVDYVEEHV